MTVNQLYPHTIDQAAVKISGNCGYRLDGDHALLNAELAVNNANSVGADEWVLQLWACDAPYSGGELHGIKVAEAPVPLQTEQLNYTQPLTLALDADAFPPAGNSDHAMVLVVVSGAQGHFENIHDFANFSLRQSFPHPRFNGDISYRIDGDQLHLQIDTIENTREADNLSGSLDLEMWALSEPYQGGSFSGIQLATAQLGQLGGGCQWSDNQYQLDFNQPPAGRWHLALMLREWTAGGYLTRDYTNFAQPFVVEEQAIMPAPEQAAEAPQADIAVNSAPEENAVEENTVVAETTAPAKNEKANGLVSVNTAGKAELSAVKWMSAKLAEAVVAGRPYQSLDGLLKIKGMGPKLLEKIRSQLEL